MIDLELCAGPRPFLTNGTGKCPELVSGYLELAGERLPVCGGHARAFVSAALELGFVPEIGGRIAGELHERGLPRHVVEALERRKQRLAKRAG